MPSTNRRLPVYLVLDMSGSMNRQGRFEQVVNALQLFESSVKSNPHALETAYISIITFAETAQRVTPLTEAGGFTCPNLPRPSYNQNGNSSLYSALKLVTSCAEKDTKRSTPTQKGDWKPSVYILTDGFPTDSAMKGEALKKFKGFNWGTVVACAAGEHRITRQLFEISDNVIYLDVADSSAISDFFEWVSDSISLTSEKIGDNTNSQDEFFPQTSGNIHRQQPKTDCDSESNGIKIIKLF